MPLAKATLTLYINKLSTPGRVSVSTASGAWTEMQRTAGNAPAVGPVIATVPVTTTGFYSVDVTSAVNAWRGATPNFGFVLAPSADAPTTLGVLDSKENTSTSHAPELDMNFSLVGPAGHKDLPVLPARPDPRARRDPRAPSAPKVPRARPGRTFTTATVPPVHSRFPTSAAAPSIGAPPPRRRGAISSSPISPSMAKSLSRQAPSSAPPVTSPLPAASRHSRPRASPSQDSSQVSRVIHSVRRSTMDRARDSTAIWMF